MSKLTPIQEAIDQPRRVPTAEQFKLCPQCGQGYDTFSALEVAHHEGQGAHDPQPIAQTT